MTLCSGDGWWSKLVNAVPGTPQGRNRLYGHADDCTLVVVVPSPSEIVAVPPVFKNCDLNRFSKWCVPWASKTETIIVSRSCTIHPQSTPLILDATFLNSLMTLSYCL